MGAQPDDFAEFYEASYGRMVALVAAIVGDRQQAEDIAQEAFARALARWSQISRYDLPEAWVRRVALRLTVDARRKLRRALQLSAWLTAGQRGREQPPDPLASTALTVALMRLPVLRRRTRRRGIRRAAAAATAVAIVAAAAVGIAARLPGTARPAGGGGSPAYSAPADWPAAPGTWTHGAWQPAGPQPAAGASPAVAPYIVLAGILGGVQVRNVFTDKTIATIKPLAGQYLGGVEAAGDDRTFVVQAETGGRSQVAGVPQVNPAGAAFDELRLRPDGQLQSLRLLFTVSARDGLSGFAISQDASMLAYATNNSGFETVSLATGKGRSWPPVDSGTVSPDSLSWAGDRTLGFEWGTGDNLHPPGIGIRLLDVAAPGTLLRASRLVVGYARYCAPSGGCLGDPVITADGSRVIVTKVAARGGTYLDSVVEYSTRTGRALASVMPPVTMVYPCEPLWTDPSGAQVVAWCVHGVLYDRGQISPITLHLHMNGTDIEAFAW